ncbi:M14 metallopeptidase family protein [Acidobacteriota bacterium]
MRKLFIHLFICSLMLIPLMGAEKITSPLEHMGHNIGDDYFLANFTQLESYWKKLDSESDRMVLQEIGRSAEGRPIYMSVITSPENHENLDHYKEIASRMALAESLTDTEARKFAAEGKAVVWIDGGLHGSEVLGAQQLIEIVYQLVSGTDSETLRILNDVIILAIPSNPDGMELVSNWYMREEDQKKRSTRGLPRLYHKYVGHDNNRDFFMTTQPETEALNRILFREWFPQIVYNHHQTGPAGTVLFAPPFRDPFNYTYDPLITTSIQQVGSAMHSRFLREGKPGATMRSGAGYSIWWNGGLRTTVYFHNIIGILTETIGNPTPMEIPFIPAKHLPNSDYPFPISPQTWHFRQSVDYSITANKAILDLASKLREDFLFNIYRMGKNSILRGNRDSWTMSPKRLQAVQDKIEKDNARMTGSGRSRGYSKEYYDQMYDSESRDPRGYIIPSDQKDFLTAIKFVNTLIKNGIFIDQATEEFSVGDKTYPAGSFVVKTAQAFRPHLLTMFEPQHYPHDIPYPGAPPTPTYDNAGWTLAFQMGIQFDRILDGFEGPFQRLTDFAQVPGGKIFQNGRIAGYLLDHSQNDSFVALNILLNDGEKVYWAKEDFKLGKGTYPAGTFFIPAQTATRTKLEKIAKNTGLSFFGIAKRPEVDMFLLKPVRIGIWDQYGGSMASGWLRWLLEQFQFPFEVVYPPTLDAGDLNDKFDVLIFASGGIPGGSAGSGTSRRPSEVTTEGIPPEYHDILGRVTAQNTVPQILDFLKNGGTVLTLGRSTNLGFHAGLPIKNALVEKMPDGSERTISREKYFIPGSILQARVDNHNPLAHGLPEHVDFMFNFSPVFSFKPEAALQGIKPVAWFDGKTPLRSGWAWGQHHLDGAITVIEAQVGRGKLFLFGPEILFRGQPHGTFKFLFNGIYYGPASAGK